MMYIFNYMRLVSTTRKFSFKDRVRYFFFSELNCHFQNYQCPGHFFSRKTQGEFVNEHIKQRNVIKTNKHEEMF